jgi:hypothetical protein
VISGEIVTGKGFIRGAFEGTFYNIGKWGKREEREEREGKGKEVGMEGERGKGKGEGGRGREGRGREGEGEARKEEGGHTSRLSRKASIPSLFSPNQEFMGIMKGS